MSFFTPEFGIAHYNQIPVVCSKCGRSDIWKGMSQETKNALIQATALHSLTGERDLLRRTAELVARFPGTRHPLLHFKMEGHSRHLTSTADAAVDAELQNDKSLRDFLTNAGFGLADRTDWVDRRLTELKAYQQRTDLQCKTCGGYAYLPDDFYEEIGTYLERMAEKQAR